MQTNLKTGWPLVPETTGVPMARKREKVGAFSSHSTANTSATAPVHLTKGVILRGQQNRTASDPQTDGALALGRQLYISAPALWSRRRARAGPRKGARALAPPQSAGALAFGRIAQQSGRQKVRSLPKLFFVTEVIFLFFSTGCSRTEYTLGESPNQAYNS